MGASRTHLYGGGHPLPHRGRRGGGLPGGPSSVVRVGPEAGGNLGAFRTDRFGAKGLPETPAGAPWPCEVHRVTHTTPGSGAARSQGRNAPACPQGWGRRAVLGRGFAASLQTAVRPTGRSSLLWRVLAGTMALAGGDPSRSARRIGCLRRLWAPGKGPKTLRFNTRGSVQRTVGGRVCRPSVPGEWRPGPSIRPLPSGSGASMQDRGSGVSRRHSCLRPNGTPWPGWP